MARAGPRSKRVFGNNFQPAIDNPPPPPSPPISPPVKLKFSIAKWGRDFSKLSMVFFFFNETDTNQSSLSKIQDVLYVYIVAARMKMFFRFPLSNFDVTRGELIFFMFELYQQTELNLELEEGDENS